jgi:hypothetical protein
VTAPTTFAGVVSHARVRARAVAGGAVWSVLAPLLFVATGKLIGPPGGGPPSWAGWALVAIVAAGVIGATLAFRSATRPAALEVGDREVVLVEGGNRRRIAKRSIENAMLVDDDRGKQLLELNLVGRETLTLDFGASEGARAALDALALANERNVTRIRMYPRNQEALTELSGGLLGAMIVGLPVGALASLLGAMAPFVIIGCMIPAMFYGARWLRNLLPELVVGADGVSIRGTAGKARGFVPHDQVAGIEVVRRDLPKNPNAQIVELVTTDGERLVLASHFATQGALADAQKRRIDQAIVERRMTGAPVPSFVELERQGRPTSTWLEALRDVGRQQPDYRRAQLTSEQLDALLTNGSTSAERRLGAAVVLAARGEPDAKRRIRIASEASADPTISKALLAVAEGEAEEAAIAEAIEAQKA